MIMNLSLASYVLAFVTLGSFVVAQEPAPRSGGLRGSPRGGYPGGMFSSPILPKSDREKAVLAVLEDMDRNQRRGSMSVPMEDGRILRLFAESIRATNVVEVGTSVGYSAIWFCLALEKTGGKLTTFEIDPGRADRARENFKRAGVDNLVTVVVGDAHDEVKKLKAPIDMLFLDADKQGYVDYLEKLLPLVRPGGLVIAHNMNHSQADARYVKAITTNPDLETIFLNLQSSGIGVTMKKL